MEPDLLELALWDPREATSTTLLVERLAANHFRLAENDVFNPRLTLRTEFETRVNPAGKHELARVTQESPLVTRRLWLPATYKESDYRVIGDELMRRGGFWQVDFGKLATVNLPPDAVQEFDEALRLLGLTALDEAAE